MSRACLVAFLLCAACGAPALRPWPVPAPGFEVGGEPLYSDDEAALFAMRLRVRNDQMKAHPRHVFLTPHQMMRSLGISLARLRRGDFLADDACNWLEYRLSPSWTLTATYGRESPFDGAMLAIVRG